MQLTQQLKPNDHRQRRAFANSAIEQLEIDPDFGRNIMFSNEAYFWLSGLLTSKIAEFGVTKTHRRCMRSHYIPKKLLFFRRRRSGIYSQRQAIQGHDKRFFWPAVDGINLRNMWFQQYGATCHTARDTLTLLHEKFEGSVISRNGDVNWPPRSCDLTSLDFFSGAF